MEQEDSTKSKKRLQRSNSVIHSHLKESERMKTWTNQLLACDMENQEVLKVLKDMTAFIKDTPTLCGNVTSKSQAVDSIAGSLKKVLISMCDLSDLTQWQCVQECYTIILEFSDQSKAFAAAFGNADVIPTITKNVDPSSSPSTSEEQNDFLVRASLIILFNLAKVQSNIQLLRDARVNELLIPLISVDSVYIKAMSMMILAFITEEKDNHLLNETGTIDYIVDLLRKSLEQNSPQMGLSAHELAHSLGRLAINDNNKTKIKDSGGLELLIQMTESTTMEEKISSTMALWTCAFDKKICKDLEQNEALMSRLDQFQQIEQLKEAAIGIIFLIQKQEEDNAGETESCSLSPGHIMISYNWDNGHCQNSARWLAKRLQMNSYKVWIDVDQMHGSLLVAMAEAIEEACVVIMCMSEGYKRSNNCRLEAEYAHQKKKTIIPLLMDKQYAPDGWLGLLLGKKLYVPYSKDDDLDDSYSELMHQLKQYNILSSPKKTHKPRSTDSVDTGIEHKALTWTEQQVQEWLTENNLGSFCEHFNKGGFDGALLLKLKKVRQEAPEFFYKIIWEMKMKEGFADHLKEVLNFVEALEMM